MILKNNNRRISMHYLGNIVPNGKTIFFFTKLVSFKRIKQLYRLRSQLVHTCKAQASGSQDSIGQSDMRDFSAQVYCTGFLFGYFMIPIDDHHKVLFKQFEAHLYEIIPMKMILRNTILASRNANEGSQKTEMKGGNLLLQQ